MTAWGNVVRAALLGTIAIPTLFGASSALDFARFVQSSPAQTGTWLGADKNGYLYAVGITADHNSFPVTPGALNVPPSPQPTAAVFLQKLSPDGSQVLISAVLGETNYVSQAAVQVDSLGNIYVAFISFGQVAGTAKWQGDPNGEIAVLKVDSGGDSVLYASRFDPPPFSVGPLALALDSDGSVYVAGDNYSAAQVWKLGPTGSLTNYSYIFTDTPAPGGNTYDMGYIRVAVFGDHSIYVMASPSFLYHLDPSGTTILARTNVGDRNVQLKDLAADSAGNAYVSGTATSKYGVSSNQIGFADSEPGLTPGLIVKFDPSGSLIYSDLLPIDEVTALTVNPKGDVWAGGLSLSGLT